MGEPIEVAFEAVAGLVFVQAEICSLGPFTMLLDTAAAESSIDLPIARRLGLPLEDIAYIDGLGTQEFQASVVFLPNLTVGSLRTENLHATAQDLSHLRQALGHPWHGILGYSFLRSLVTQIDYRHKIIRFFSSRKDWYTHPTYRAGLGKAFPFRLGVGGFTPVIDGVHVDRQEVRAMIDTGTNSAFLVPYDGAKHLGSLEACKEWSSIDAHGAAGNGRVYSGRIGEIRLGDIVVLEPEIHVQASKEGWSPPAAQAAIVIGNGFLQDYLVTLDYVRRRLHLCR